MSENLTVVPMERIEKAILYVRGEKVMLDSVLAQLYEVETWVLNRAVKRNIDRFPDDFMFRLTDKEWESLSCQIGSSKTGTSLRSPTDTTKPGRGGRRYLPYVFTEHGVAMLSSVLNSERAVKVNIDIIRAFVRLRQMIVSNRELAKRLDELEKRYDSQFRIVFDAIRQLMTPAEKEIRKIGFKK